MTRNRTYFWLAALLIFVSLPARFARMNDSVWMDKAWVVNSVREPSLHNMFYTPTWTQPSPPLFLLLERGLVGILGNSEIAVRILPLIAGLAGLLLMGLTLRRWVECACCPA